MVWHPNAELTPSILLHLEHFSIPFLSAAAIMELIMLAKKRVTDFEAHYASVGSVFTCTCSTLGGFGDSIFAMLHCLHMTNFKPTSFYYYESGRPASPRQFDMFMFSINGFYCTSF